MRRFLCSFLVLLIATCAMGQITGTKTIPGDYATIEAAIADLNTQGTADPGVTFNVAANHTETAANLILTTTTGTATAPIVFQKSGSGSNPLITAGTGTGTTDGIIKFGGTDYVTFDAIDIQENPANTDNTTRMEWGYGVFMASATDASQHITIKNCVITLNKAYTGTYGIYMRNHTPTSTTAIVPTSVDGVTSYCKFYSNNISNVYSGIYLYCNSTAAYFGMNNEVGVDGGNNITNFGGAGTTTYGVYAIYQNNLKVANNVITSGTGTTTTMYGCYTGTAANSNVDIYSNTITLTSAATTSSMYGIQNAMGGSGTNNTVNIHDNIIENCAYPTATTGVWYLCYSSASAFTVNIYNNIIRNNSRAGTGSAYILYESGTSTTGFQNIYNNTIQNNTLSGAATTYCLYSYPSSGTTKNIYNNTIFGNSTAGNMYGLYHYYGATTHIYKNNIYNLTASGTSSVIHGIYSYTGTTNYIYNNFISDLNTPNSTSATAINGLSIQSGTNVYAYYNTVYLSASSSSATTFGTSAVYESTTPTVELVNNIFINRSTPVGAAYTVAHRRSSTTLTTYAANSNNNCFYASTPGVNNLIFYDGTNSDQTIDDYKARVTPRDASSFTENVSFVDVGNHDFQVNTGTPSQCESGGVIISTPNITDDFFGDPRYPNPGYPNNPSFPASFPDVGADEFAGMPNFTCTTPAPGATLSTANPICLGQTIILSLENAVPGTGISYQWESSPTGSGYTDIPSANQATYQTIPTASLYYRCKVTCMNGPVTVYSTPLLVAFPASILTTTPGSRCGIGTVELAATGSGGTLRWYAADLGGSSLGTGSPFTTPVINTTTNFYVGAEIISPGEAVIGAGATTSATYSNPFYSAYSNIHTQHLIRASELIAAGLSAGNINSIGLDVTVIGTLPMIDLSVKIASTTTNDMSAFLAPGFTEVYTNPSLMPVLGVNVLNFSTPFYWDGTSNIVVEFCHGNPSSTTTMSRTVRADNTAYVSSIKVHRTAASSSSVVCADITSNLLTYSVRPQFYFNGQIVCSSPRSAVEATVTPPPDLTLNPTSKTICSNEVLPITVTSPLGNFDTYYWSPIDNLFTDAACLVPYVAMTNATTVYVKSAVGMNATYTCQATKNSSQCVNEAQAAIIVLPENPTITSDPEVICVTGDAELNLNPATGWGAATFQWQDSPDGITYADITGANGLTYQTPTLTTTTYYRVVIKNGDGVVCTMPLFTMTVADPQLLGTTPGSRCGPGTVQLGATGTGGTLTWYESATGGIPIGTGSPFTTPVITTTTPFWVEVNAGGGGTAAVPSPTVGTSSFWTASVGWGLRFTVNSDVTIESVKMYPSNTSAGAATLQVKVTDLTDAVLYTGDLYSFSVTTTATEHVVPVNITISTPGNYKMVMTSTGINNLRRESSGVSFPYNSPGGEVSITAGANGAGTAQTTTSYYWFYYWTISSGCTSPRQEVTATIIPSPDLTITGDKTVCNDAVVPLTVLTGLADYNSFIWSPTGTLFTDPAGTIPYTGTSMTTVYARTTATGPITYTCTASNSGTGCQNIAQAIITVLPSAPSITAAPEAICISGSATLELDPETGWGAASFQWQDSPDGISFSDIPGANSQTYITPTLSATTYYRIKIYNSDMVLCSQPQYMLEVESPTLAGTTPGSRCGIGTVQLGASGSGGTITWYGSSTGGTPLGTGSPFTTPVISSTTSYWVGVVSGASGTGNVGPLDNTMGAGDYQALTHYQKFTVIASEMTLVGVHVYPSAAGNVVLNISNSGGTVLHTVTYPVTSGDIGAKTYIPVGYTIPAGVDYRIGWATGGVSMFRNSAGAVYPYTLPGVVSITGNSFSTVYYYYCYDWEVSTGCSSPLTEVVATVTPAPDITPTAVPADICPGDPSQLNVTSGNPTYNYLWTPGDLPGATQTVYPSTTTQYTVTATDPGTGCVNIGYATVTVNDVPGAVTVDPPTASTGSIVQLTALGGNVDNLVLLSQHFNDPTNDWTTINNSTGGTNPALAAWTLQPDGYSYSTYGTWHSNDNSQFYLSNADACGSGVTVSTILQSPVFNTLGMTSANIDFYHYLYEPTAGSSNARVEASTNGTDWTTVYNYTSTVGLKDNFAHAVLALPPAFVGQPSVYIRFKYDCGWRYFWGIDNVSVFGNGQADITWAPLTDLYTDAGGTMPYTGDARNVVYANPGGAVTYTATATNIFGCTSSGTCVFTALKTFNLKLYLESLYSGPNMNEAQDDMGSHWGAGIADHVRVELHNATTPYALVWAQDDVVLNTDGTAILNVPSAHGGSYYVAIKHRNSIETWSGAPVSFTGSIINYDFSTAASKAYGDNQQEVNDNVYGIYAGDVNQDGIVDSNDMGDVDNDANNFIMGYVASDANGDGVVDSNDMGLVDNNANAFIMAILP